MKWSYNTSFIPLESGLKYSVQCRGVDNANNTEISASIIEFYIDKDKPISFINYPINNSILNTLNMISGNVSDPGSSGIETLEVSIRRHNDNYYWNGIRWFIGESWIVISDRDLDNWTFNTSHIVWESDSNYSIRVRAIDGVGNVELPGYGTTFFYDSKPPEYSFKIDNGSEYTKNDRVSLVISAKDSGSGLAEISFSTDGINWTNWEIYTTTKDFILDEGDGEKRIFLRVKDMAGNIGEPIIGQIILDTTKPDISLFAINDNDEFTNSYSINLNITAIDILSGIEKMSFSIDYTTWSAWEAFDNSKKYSLIAPDGEKSVYIQVMDRAGNIAQSFDEIILDTTSPHSLSIVINNGSKETNSNIVTLKVSAQDDLSGISQMAFRIVEGQWSDWEDFSSSKTLKLSSGAGKNTIYFLVRDRAGNEAIAVSADINLKKDESISSGWNTLLISSIVVIVVIIIIIIVIVLFFKKRRKGRDKKEEAQDILKEEKLTPETSTSDLSNVQVEDSIQEPYQESIPTPISSYPQAVNISSDSSEIIDRKKGEEPFQTDVQPNDEFTQQYGDISLSQNSKNGETQLEFQGSIDVNQSIEPQECNISEIQTQSTESVDQFVQCPICQNQVQMYSNPCPFCSSELKWE
jgi:hypothetical protein